MRTDDIGSDEGLGLMDLLSELKELCLAQEHKIQKALDLSPGEFDCLRVFPVSEELDVGAIASRLSLSHSRASRIVDKLVKKSLLRRRQDSTDRRAVALRLTSMGGETKNKLEVSIQHCERSIYAEMDEDARRTVRQAFALVRGAMELSDARN
jgi:DNA-binding MarR family transcriptional regulator